MTLEKTYRSETVFWDALPWKWRVDDAVPYYINIDKLYCWQPDYIPWSCRGHGLVRRFHLDQHLKPSFYYLDAGLVVRGTSRNLR